MIVVLLLRQIAVTEVNAKLLSNRNFRSCNFEGLEVSAGKCDEILEPITRTDRMQLLGIQLG